MNLFITDNLLRVARVIKLHQCNYAPANGEDLPSIDATKQNIRTLYKNKVSFILDLKKNETPPDYIKLVPHPEYKYWMIPKYMLKQAAKATYSVEYVDNDILQYKDGLSESDIEAGIASGFDIRRIMPENGAKLRKKFLSKIGMRKIEKKKLVYAVQDKSI